MVRYKRSRHSTYKIRTGAHFEEIFALANSNTNEILSERDKNANSGIIEKLGVDGSAQNMLGDILSKENVCLVCLDSASLTTNIKN
ncbi:unnamed protein product [Cunninghamella echinulata]